MICLLRKIKTLHTRSRLSQPKYYPLTLMRGQKDYNKLQITNSRRSDEQYILWEDKPLFNNTNITNTLKNHYNDLSINERIFNFGNYFLQSRIAFSFAIFRKEGILKKQSQPQKTQKKTSIKSKNQNSSKAKNNDQVEKSRFRNILLMQKKSTNQNQKIQSNLFRKDQNKSKKYQQQSQTIKRKQKNVTQFQDELYTMNTMNSQIDIYFQDEPQIDQPGLGKTVNKHVKSIQSFNGAKSVKQLISCLQKIQAIAHIKNQPAMGFFINKMNQLLTKQEYLQNQKEITKLIHEIKGYTNQKNSTVDQILSILYFFKLAKDFGYDYDAQGFQVRTTARLFQLFKNNQLTFQQLLFAYYITSYLGCSNHELKWKFTMALVSQYEIYIKIRVGKATKQILDSSIIFGTKKNIMSSQIKTFMKPAQFLMILSTYQFYTNHLLSDLLAYQLTIQNIWKQKIQNLMNNAQKAELFDLYLSINLIIIVQKTITALKMPLSQLKVEFKRQLYKQEMFFKKKMWLNLIQSINFYQFNYNKLHYLYEANLLHEFAIKIVNIITGKQLIKDKYILIRFLITPAINKSIKKIYGHDQTKVGAILQYIKQYFNNLSFLNRKESSQQIQICNLLVGFLNVDFPKIQSESIFTKFFLRELLDECIMKKYQFDLVSPIFWMLEFSYLSFQNPQQIQKRIDKMLRYMRNINLSEVQQIGREINKIIYKIYAYITKYLEVCFQDQNYKSSNTQKYADIKKILQQGILYNSHQKKLDNIFSKSVVQKIISTKFDIVSFFQAIVQETKYHRHHYVAEQIIDQIYRNLQLYAKPISQRVKQVECILRLIMMAKNKYSIVVLKQKASRIIQEMTKMTTHYKIFQMIQASVFPNARKIDSSYVITDFTPMQVQIDRELTKQNFKFLAQEFFPLISIGHFSFVQILIDNMLKFDIKLRDQIFKVVFPAIHKGVDDGKFELMKKSRLIFMLSKMLQEGLITKKQNPQLVNIFQKIHKYANSEGDKVTLYRHINQTTKNLLACDLLTVQIKKSLKQVQYQPGKFKFNYSLDIVDAIQSHFVPDRKDYLDSILQDKSNTETNTIIITQFLHLEQDAYKNIKNHLRVQQFLKRTISLLNSFCQGLPKYEELIKISSKQLKKQFYFRKQQLSKAFLAKGKQFQKRKQLQNEQKQAYYQKIAYIQKFLSEGIPNQELIPK